MSKIVPPAFKGQSYTCPQCGALAQMTWLSLRQAGPGFAWEETTFFVVKCFACKKHHCWVPTGWNDSDAPMDGYVVYPAARLPIDLPEGVPEEIAGDMREAADIARRSPRGACALLRLVLDKLLIHFEPSLSTERDLAARIAKLAEQGKLPEETRLQCEVVRVTGNEAVHPLTMDLRDDVETVEVLFGILDNVIERLIVLPAKLKAAHDNLPANKRKDIEDRMRQARGAKGQTP